MGRMVITPFRSIAIGADATQDLWSLMAPSTNKLVLHGWEITSDSLVAENLEIALLRLSAVGTGGANATEAKLDTDGGAIVGAVRTGDTTPGTPGDVLKGFAWEQLGPLGLIYTPEMRIPMEVSTGIALVCDTAVAFEMSGWVCWEEL